MRFLPTTEEIIEKIINKYLWQAPELCHGFHFHPLLERICAPALATESGLLQMQNFPFIFKISYPNVVGRELIYAGAQGEPLPVLRGRIKEGLKTAKLTGARQNLQLIIETIGTVTVPLFPNEILIYS